MQFRPILLLAGLCAVTAAVALTALFARPGPSEATFPGANGKIAFVSGIDSYRGIYVMNADGTGQTPLTDPLVFTFTGSPDWSPDGSRLAFDALTIGGPTGATFAIWVMNADGSGLVQLPQVQGYHAVWSPDGSKIAFTKSGEIYSMNSDGTGVTNLTNNPASDSSPAWSPDGSKIAFPTYRDADWELWVMNADGSNPTRLTYIPGSDGDPDWSPDGSKIAFAHYATKNDLYVMSSDGSGQVNITNSPSADDTHPRWSPDGSRIAFRSGRAGEVDVYTINPDGTGEARLTDNGAALDYDPDWQPLGGVDTDGDGCADDREAGPDQMQGGQRDPLNPWDFFNPVKTAPIGGQTVTDILMVVQQYNKNDNDGNPGLPPYAPGYTPDTDRTYLGPNVWNLGPPDGTQTVTDILAAIKQYNHNCAP